jgi:hypothetical protein
MTVDIIHTTIHDLQSDPDLLGLLMEYSCESGMSGLPPPKWNFGTYSMMESQGFLHPIAAYVDDHLVGFLLLLVHDLPHYSVPVAVSRSSATARGGRSGDRDGRGRDCGQRPSWWETRRRVGEDEL